MKLKCIGRTLLILSGLFMGITVTVGHSTAGDLADIIKSGKLRHLGIVYANFVTPDKAGLDVELMKLFSAHLGIGYEFVETNWQTVIADLTGKVVSPKGEDDIEIKGESPVRGDIIATGFTVLPWRKKVVDFSDTTFPTGVWLISRSDSALQPIVPTNDISKDIEAVKKKLSGVSVLTLKNSCLDPELYGISNTGATVRLFPADRNLDEMIPAIIARMAESTLMDVPVALVALEESPGGIKVIGPISQLQEMACAFPKTSPNLRKAFNDFLRQCKKDGRYKSLMKKYYPSVFLYYPDFLEKK